MHDLGAMIEISLFDQKRADNRKYSRLEFLGLWFAWKFVSLFLNFVLAQRNDLYFQCKLDHEFSSLPFWPPCNSLFSVSHIGFGHTVVFLHYDMNGFTFLLIYFCCQKVRQNNCTTIPCHTVIRLIM